MKAISVPEYGTRDVLEVTDMDKPDPGSGQVLIEVESAGVNFSDVMQRRGSYYGVPEPPFVPGTEVAGRIAAVGEGVEREIGEEVFTLVSMDDGGYAEYTVAHEAMTIKLPDTMSFSEGAGFPAQFVTAHSALHEWGKLEEDENVLIHAAAGGVGTAACQIADLQDVTIFGTASTAEKLKFAARNGLEHGINYTEQAFEYEVDRLTDGDGVDLILDGVGGSVLAASVDALAEFGRIVTYGAASGEITEIDSRDIFFQNKSIRGFHLGNALENHPKRIFLGMSALRDLIDSDDLHVVIDEEFSLEDCVDAHEMMEDRQTTGKIVLKI
jgi:NADPH2:quinone reductase